MAKFISRCFIVSVLVLLALVVVHVCMIVHYRKLADKVFQHDENTKILFVGSSQMGCSVDVSSDYLMRII